MDLWTFGLVEWFYTAQEEDSPTDFRALSERLEDGEGTEAARVPSAAGAIETETLWSGGFIEGRRRRSP